MQGLCLVRTNENLTEYELQIQDFRDDEEEPDIILARIDTDENGEAEYVPPTDDEYDAVADIYDAM